MSQYAKSIAASVAAVLIAGVTAWQTVVGGAPFRLLDVLPIATAVVGAFFTYLVPEVPELTRAKSWIAGGFAVLTAVTTFASGHPADVTVLNLLIAGLGAVTTGYVPNLAPLAQAAETLPPEPPAGPAAAAVEPPAPVQAVWTQELLSPVVPAPRLEATPIADDVQSVLETTSPMPAVTADTAPAVPAIPAA